MTATDPENGSRLLHTIFQILPSKKRYPEYYEVIENPIDLRMIATKIQNNTYTNLNEMEKDLLMMTKNACLFNEPGSQVYKDAKALKKVVIEISSIAEIECMVCFNSFFFHINSIGYLVLIISENLSISLFSITVINRIE